MWPHFVWQPRFPQRLMWALALALACAAASVGTLVAAPAIANLAHALLIVAPHFPDRKIWALRMTACAAARRGNFCPSFKNCTSGAWGCCCCALQRSSLAGPPANTRVSLQRTLQQRAHAVALCLWPRSDCLSMRPLLSAVLLLPLALLAQGTAARDDGYWPHVDKVPATVPRRPTPERASPSRCLLPDPPRSAVRCRTCRLKQTCRFAAAALHGPPSSGPAKRFDRSAPARCRLVFASSPAFVFEILPLVVELPLE